MALLHLGFKSVKIVLFVKDLVQNEKAIEDIENEFKEFLQNHLESSGFIISQKIRAYVAYIRSLIPKLRKLIGNTDNEELRSLNAIKKTLAKELEIDIFNDEIFVGKEQQLIAQISEDVDNLRDLSKQISFEDASTILNRVIDLNRLESLVSNLDDLEKKKSQKNFRIDKYLLFLLNNLDKENLQEVKDEIISVITLLEEIIRFSVQIEVELTQITALRLYSLNHFIDALKSVGENYGLTQEDITSLESVKDELTIVLSDEVNSTVKISNLDEQLKAHHNNLIEKIQNSEVIHQIGAGSNVRLSVKRYYVLANMVRDELDLDNVFLTDRSLLISTYRRLFEEVSTYPESKVDEIIGEWQPRLDAFNKLKWSFKKIDISQMGVWPKMGDLDSFTTSGNLPDTAKKIKAFSNNSSEFRWPDSSPPNIQADKIMKFKSIIRNVDTIYKLFPIIITQSCSRRPDENVYNGDSLGFNFEVTPYDIDDGCHRAVGFAMSGVKEVMCFVGKGKGIYK
jgi:hypothetical protein